MEQQLAVHKKLINLLLLIQAVILLTACDYFKKPEEKPQLSIDQEIASDLQLARECIPQIGDQGVKFCTGVAIASAEMAEMAKWDMATCQKAIDSKEYKVVTEFSKSAKPDEFKIFTGTTQNALALHSIKEVYFKNHANIIDCVHEYLHILQWSRYNNTHPLSPWPRDEKFNKLKNYVLNKSLEIESLEKANKLEAAMQLAQAVTPAVEMLKEYGRLSEWLDEKDVYYFFFRFCHKGFVCSDDDMETVVANLFKMKEKLPPHIFAEVKAEVTQRVLAKEKKALSLLPNYALDLGPKEDWRKLATASPNIILEAMKKNKIEIYYFDKNNDEKKFQKNLTLSVQELKSYKTPPTMVMQELARSNRLVKGFDEGRYLCGQNTARFVVMATTTKLDLLRALALHHFMAAYPKTCIFYYPLEKISEDFSNGKISRQYFESEILKSKMTRFTIQSYIDHFLQKYIDLLPGPLKARAQWNTMLADLDLHITPVKSFVSSPPQELKFVDSDDLPILKMNDVHLILDLGAMDSVISPDWLFKYAKREDLSAYAQKKLRRVNGEEQKILQVLYKGIMRFGKDEITPTLWALADMDIKGIQGVLGLDFWSDKEFSIYPQEGKVVLENWAIRPGGALPLQKEHDGKVIAIEFKCANDLIVRLDSGSQVMGDMSEKIGPLYKKIIDEGKSINCAGALISGPLRSDVQNQIIFDRGVHINMGWPWMRKFQKISISLRHSWIKFYSEQ